MGKKKIAEYKLLKFAKMIMDYNIADDKVGEFIEWHMSRPKSNHHRVPKNYDINKPFFRDVKRIPRKLKKKMKNYIGCHWGGITNEQRMWHYMGKKSPNYKRYLIDRLCNTENHYRRFLEKEVLNDKGQLHNTEGPAKVVSEYGRGYNYHNHYYINGEWVAHKFPSGTLIVMNTELKKQYFNDLE